MDTTQSGGILITGGTGYLGNVLVRQAQALGKPVAATYFSQQPPIDDEVCWIALDVSDAWHVEDTIERLRPEIIVHTAYRQRDPGLWAISAEGTRNVAHAARLVGARLVHISSDAIFDGTREGAYCDDDPPSPVTDYGRAKAAAESFVKEHTPEAAIVRTSLIYGFSPIDVHTQFVLKIADGLSDAALFTDEMRCPIFVEDLATAVLALAQNDYSGVLNVAGAEALSRYEFGRLLAAMYERDPNRLTSARSADSGMNRPRNCVLDSSRARALLNLPLRGVSEVFSLHTRTV